MEIAHSILTVLKRAATLLRENGIAYCLAGGDIILLATGGHGFEVLEELEMIEVKQGPYAGDRDKTRFEAVGKKLVKVKQ